MSAQNIAPMWSNIQPGDIVTLQIGEPGKPGYRAGTYEATRGTKEICLAGGSLTYWSGTNWELVSIIRPDTPMQTHKGALGMSDRGIVVHDGDRAVPFWIMSSGASAMVCHDLDESFGEIVPAVPVPLVEYKALHKTVTDNEGCMQDVYHAANALVIAAGHQWDRDGMRQQVKLD